MLAKLLLQVCLLSLNRDIHWREGATLVMLAKLLLWVCLLSLNQDIHWREGTPLVMLAKLLLRVCLLFLNRDIHWREGATLVMLAKLLLWVQSRLTLFESRYTLKGRCNIGNVGKTASMSMLTLFESRYTCTLNHKIKEHNNQHMQTFQLNGESKSRERHSQDFTIIYRNTLRASLTTFCKCSDIFCMFSLTILLLQG